MEIKIYVSVSDKERETEISHKMIELGIPANRIGYNYIRTAILIAMKNPKILEKPTKTLYPEVAKIHNTAAKNVSEVIRKTIKRVFTRKPEHFKEFFNKPEWFDCPSSTIFLESFLRKIQNEN